MQEESGRAPSTSLASCVRSGSDRGTVAQRLKERGVRLGRFPMEQSGIERARSLNGEGLSINEIGRLIGRDPKTVKAAL